jgi:hypothetical protein
MMSVGDKMVNKNNSHIVTFTAVEIGCCWVINQRAAPVTAITNVGLSAAELNMTTEISTSAK